MGRRIERSLRLPAGEDKMKWICDLKKHIASILWCPVHHVLWKDNCTMMRVCNFLELLEEVNGNVWVSLDTTVRRTTKPEDIVVVLRLISLMLINNSTTHLFAEFYSAASKDCTNISALVLGKVLKLKLQRVSNLRKPLTTIAHRLCIVIHNTVPGVIEKEEGPLSSISPIMDSFLPEITHKLLKFSEITIVACDDLSHIRSKLLEASLCLLLIFYHCG